VSNIIFASVGVAKGPGGPYMELNWYPLILIKGSKMTRKRLALKEIEVDIL
jgi:hypothetical protein